MRVILYTGKGGVGKTTVAAATALRLAETGRRTLVLSTDPAHSLGDALGQELGNQPRPVAEALDALEIDALTENDRAWGALRSYLGRLLARGEELSLATEETLLLPGMGELFNLLAILDHAESGEYDTLVVDCAPTGETLSLLKYPERLDRLFRIALPTKRALVKALGRPFEKLINIAMPEDRLFDDLLTLLDRLTRLGELLRDKDTTVRLVTTPERIVVAEVRRAYTWLSLYGFVVDQVVVNRIYPEVALAGYFAAWAPIQAAGLETVSQSFGHLPVHRLELQDHEIAGLTGLRELSRELYGDGDPAVVGYQGDRLRLTRHGDEVCLHLWLPGAQKSQLDLQHEGNDLIVAYRNQRRRIALPDSVLGRQVSSAQYRDDELVVSMR